MLTYDKDFNMIKKLYKYLYSKEIDDIDEFDDFNYPLKIKNYISSNHYFKSFLKKDFNFFDSGYLKYSHKFLFDHLNINNNKSFDDLRSKNIFPSKEIFLLSDFPNNNLNYENSKFYYCELITNHGSIFGKFIILENGVLFISDWKNDKRINNDYLDYVLSTTKFDILKDDKKIFLNYTQIYQIINRTFCFHWTSQEIFMKNGKSYFFNFFKTKFNEEIFDIYKLKLKKFKNILIQNPKEYFLTEDYTKKYKENIITTYEYLLLINKFSSRSYNNIIEYPIMPWLLFGDKIRNFDYPMSLQTEESMEKFEKLRELDDDDFAHNNHYSNSAYVIFYLFRINPFSNGMIKLQKNSFEIPERQFSSIDNTIKVCPATNNNREPIPDLFELPEIYYNLNCNGLGKMKTGKKREHNINFAPYAENGIEFCYKFLDEINNNPEINSNINKWIDYIFGVNQFNSNSKEFKYRKFSAEFYSQNSCSNFEKQISSSKDKKVDEKQIYKDIKINIDSPLNFGLCPIPILTELTPKKNILNDNLAENKDKADEIINLININKNRFLNNRVIYFEKKKKNKNIIVLFENGLLYILSPKKKNINDYEILTEIKIKGLLYHNLIAKYTFCELKDDFYVFCGFLDKTLKFYHKDKNKFNYLLNISTTSILSNCENEFITGHLNGKIIKWEFATKSGNGSNDYEIKKIMEIKSNKNAILCIEYEQKLNVLLSCDNNSIVIRNYYNFEFLTLIKIKEYETTINKITKLKIFNCNLIYVLVKLNENESYELHCYSLNGTFYKKIKGYYTDFNLTKTGNIFISNLKNNEISLLKGCNLDKLFSKSFPFIEEYKSGFLFDFEIPNIIYFCHEEKENISIKKFYLMSMIFLYLKKLFKIDIY